MQPLVSSSVLMPGLARVSPSSPISPISFTMIAVFFPCVTELPANSQYGSCFPASEKTSYDHDFHVSLHFSCNKIVFKWCEMYSLFYDIYKIGSASRPGSNGNGYCGAGFEEKLVWMEVDYKCNILNKSSYLLNSCLRNYELLRIEWNEYKYLKVEVEFFKARAMAKYIISYDKSNPENGLKIEYK